jgi:simple sugar transport system ATP-binding protein
MGRTRARSSSTAAHKIRTPEGGDAARHRDHLPVQCDGPDDVDRPQCLHRARAIKFGLFGFGILDQKRMREESVQAIADVELHLRSPDALVGELSGGQRQGRRDRPRHALQVKVLVLDEPTNHLSVKETNKVLGFIRGLKAQNVTGIFISHNIPHVFQSCDRIVAMARGRSSFDKPVGETSIEEVQELL